MTRMVPSPTRPQALLPQPDFRQTPSLRAPTIHVESLRLAIPDIEPARARALTERVLSRLSQRLGRTFSSGALGALSLRVNWQGGSEEQLEQALEQALVSAISRSSEEA